MNSTTDGSNNIENQRQGLDKRLARFSGSMGLGLFLLLGAMPNLAPGAQHGAGIFKNPIGPPPLFSSMVHTGDIITATIRVRNLDSFGDSLTITNIVDMVHHASGDTTSPNLLAAAVTLTNFGDFVAVSNSYPVLASDGNLT